MDEVSGLIDLYACVQIKLVGNCSNILFSQDDYYTSNYYVGCTNDATPPFASETESYDVFSTFSDVDHLDDDDAICDDTAITYYEAFPIGTCLSTLFWFDKRQEGSAIFDSTPEYTAYEDDRLCSSSATTYSATLETACHALGSDYEAGKWSVYTA